MARYQWNRIGKEQVLGWGRRWAGSTWSLQYVRNGHHHAIIQKRDEKYFANMWVNSTNPLDPFEPWRVDGPFDTEDEAKAYAQAIVVLDET